MRLIEDRDGATMKLAGTWRKWVLILAMIAWIYAANSMLQNVASPSVKYTLIGAVIGITVVLIGLSIAAEQVFPFAAGLILLGTLLSSIPLFHDGSFSFHPDHWKIAVALAGAASLLLSRWIRRVVHHLCVLYRLACFEEKSESTLGDERDDVQILIRFNRGFDSLWKPRCTVTIRHPRNSARNAAQANLWNASGRSGRAPNLHDHKLPFWVR
jgi:hypothetical protein